MGEEIEGPEQGCGWCPALCRIPFSRVRMGLTDEELAANTRSELDPSNFPAFGFRWLAPAKLKVATE